MAHAQAAYGVGQCGATKMTPWYDNAGYMLVIAAMLTFACMLGVTAMIRSRQSYRAIRCSAGEHPWRKIGKIVGQTRYECRWCHAAKVVSRTYALIDDGRCAAEMSEHLSSGSSI